jgi:MerR family transcriptional regulator/heat shock protein HspR
MGAGGDAPRPRRRPLAAGPGPSPGMPAAFDDADYPAYAMSAAVDMLGVQPGFLRGLGEAGLLEPARSGGGHRRYSRHDLQVAARARQVVDDGMTLAAACRIVQLEFELAAVRAELAAARAAIAELDDRR